MNSLSPELQLKDTAIRNKLIYLLTEFRGFKFVTTLVVKFKKIESDDTINHSWFSSNSKAKRIINESDIDDVFESI